MASLNKSVFLAIGAVGLVAAGALNNTVGLRGAAAPAAERPTLVGNSDSRCQPSSKFTGATASWKAAAPGRIEPKGGEFRIWAATLGRIAAVYPKVGDLVEADQLLIKLDDDEARANLAAAEAEAASAKHARDQAASTLAKDRQELRDAEDAVYQSEREMLSERLSLDFVQTSPNRTDTQVTDARKQFADAKTRHDTAIRNLGAALRKRLPDPSQIEAAVNKARSMVAIARAQFEKTRIRAKAAGKVLDIDAKSGEIASPSIETPPLMSVGDTSRLHVVAEVDEADVRHVTESSSAFVCAASEPGREFNGHVVRIAQTLGSVRLSRGPLRPSDIEVLKVWVELDSAGPLKPGMRAEVFFQ